MAVNLLALAKQLETSLAKKGRRGDTKIRRVKGEPSHVNTTEAKAIDSFGPIGEAWVQSVGSGTINPKTGLREYGWFSDALKGDYTSMGGSKTKARKARDRLLNQTKSRHKMFENFRTDFEDENIAGIFTEDEDDDTSKTKGWAGDFNKFIKHKSGLNYPFGFINDTSISNYTDKYDSRKEDELIAQKERALQTDILQTEAFGRMGEQQDLQKATLDQQSTTLDQQESAAFSADTSAQKETGAALSSGLFGMLTQAQETTSQKGFAGSGNFAQDFQKKMAVQSAGRSLAQSTLGRTQTQQDVETGRAGVQTGRDKLAIERRDLIGQQDVADIQKASMLAETQAGIADLQEDYNQEFWNNMISWDSAINA